MKEKPFPWRCPTCREPTVTPVEMEYAETVDHDGRSYEVRIPKLKIPQCKKCGRRIVTDSINEAISDALRRAAGLLLPSEIRERRKALGYNQEQFAALLGVAEATLSRWETGAQIQQRSLNNYMKVVFDVPASHEYLRRQRGSPTAAPLDVQPNQRLIDI